MHERAKIIVEMEVQHPGWHTFRKYMHALEPADEDSAPAPDWEGITGRMKQLLGRTEARVDELSSKMATKSEVAVVASKLDDMMDRMDTMMALIKTLSKQKNVTC